MWHQSKEAQELLATLTEQDLRIVRPHRYERGLALAPATEHGCKVFDRLDQMYTAPIESLYHACVSDEQRMAVLARVDSFYADRPTVAAALSSRFGSPDDFSAHRVDDGSATRAFRAKFADKTEWAA